MSKYLDDRLRTIIYNPREKSRVQEIYVRTMLNRTQRIFEYRGLPETIPARVLELYLQTNGNCVFHKHNDNLYIYTGGLGGEPDVYYEPTIYTIANPAQNYSKNLRIGKDCVLMRNDSLMIGLLPMFNRYAYHMTENDLSMLVADINSRIIGLISAGDDRTLNSAKQFLSDIEQGKLGVIGENAFLEGVKSQTFNATSGHGLLTDLIEYQQYLKASWFNELGLDSNYNMKRESITASEAQMNNDALLPLIDDMLKCREIALTDVNTMFNTEITVSLASAWEDNREELELEHKLLEAGNSPDTPDNPGGEELPNVS